MERHTKATDAEYLYEEMRDKFYERIKEAKQYSFGVSVGIGNF